MGLLLKYLQKVRRIRKEGTKKMFVLKIWKLNDVTRRCSSTLTVVTVVRTKEINLGIVGTGHSVVFKVQY